MFLRDPSGKQPWLGIPAPEYEAHMDEIGQAAALREIFARVYADARPRRALVLGCATGRAFDVIDPAVTERCVGVDVNPEYLAVARTRLSSRPDVALVHGDVLAVELPDAAFELVHVALLFEYVDPRALFQRTAGWLAPGGVVSTVTQNPAEGLAAVSATPYASLRALEGHMALREADVIASCAADAGLERLSRLDVPLPRGKSFSSATFRRPVSPEARADGPTRDN